MNKKTLITIVSLLILLLAIGGGVWWWEGKDQKIELIETPVVDDGGENGEEPENGSKDENKSEPETEVNLPLVTDVDMNVNHWQTKEDRFAVIKFPKEWYWMESEHAENEGYSRVITNNSNFDIDRYAYIGIFTGSPYVFITEKDGVYSETVPLSGSEIVITTNGAGWVTSNSGTPHQFMEGEFNRVRDLPYIQCNYTSSLQSIPLTAYCSFIDTNGLRVETYYASYSGRTFAFTARTIKESNLIIKDILEKIAKEFTVKNVQPYLEEFHEFQD